MTQGIRPSASMDEMEEQEFNHEYPSMEQIYQLIIYLVYKCIFRVSSEHVWKEPICS